MFALCWHVCNTTHHLMQRFTFNSICLSIFCDLAEFYCCYESRTFNWRNWRDSKEKWKKNEHTCIGHTIKRFSKPIEKQNKNYFVSMKVANNIADIWQVNLLRLLLGYGILNVIQKMQHHWSNFKKTIPYFEMNEVIAIDLIVFPNGNIKNTIRAGCICNCNFIQSSFGTNSVALYER